MKLCGWFKQAVVYHILIDRFAGYTNPKQWEKPVFIGGNLPGITDKLDYLKQLGINTIWLSPFYKTDKYHGYHVTDFFEVEPRFGNLADLKKLISIAHHKNIRVIADFVPNHCSCKHPYFIEATLNRRSKFYDWFYFKRWPEKYLCFLHFRELPKLNLKNPVTSGHIIEAAKYWLGLGIDGFRIDHVIGPPFGFWKVFSNEIKTTFKDTVLIGEAWLSGIKFRDLPTLGLKNKTFKWIFKYTQEDVQKEFTGLLDGVLDFSLRDRVVEFIAWKENPEEYLKQLKVALKTHYKSFDPGYYLPGFIDNHDMSRFMFECGNNVEKLKLALKIQLSQPQPPILYYGTETGLSHSNAVMINKANSDLQARKPMPWNNLNLELIDYCRELIAERKIKYGKEI